MLQHGRLAAAPQTGDESFDFMFADEARPRADLLRSFESLRSRRSVPYGLHVDGRHNQAPSVGIGGAPATRKWRVGGASDEQLPTYTRDAETAVIGYAAEAHAVSNDPANRTRAAQGAGSAANGMWRTLKHTRTAGRNSAQPSAPAKPATGDVSSASSRTAKGAAVARNTSAIRTTANRPTADRDAIPYHGHVTGTARQSARHAAWQQPQLQEPPAPLQPTRGAQSAHRHAQAQVRQAPVNQPSLPHSQEKQTAAPRNSAVGSRVRQPSGPPASAGSQPPSAVDGAHGAIRHAASPGRAASPPPGNYSQPTQASRLKQEALQKQRRQWQLPADADDRRQRHDAWVPSAPREAPRAASPPRGYTPSPYAPARVTPGSAGFPSASTESATAAPSTRQQKLQALKIRRARAAVVAATVAAAAGAVSSEASDLVKIVGYADQAAAADAVWVRSASTSPAKGPYGRVELSPGRRFQASPQRESPSRMSPTPAMAPSGAVLRSPGKGTQTEPAGVGLRSEAAAAPGLGGRSKSPDAADGEGSGAVVKGDDTPDPTGQRPQGDGGGAGTASDGNTNRRPRMADMIRKFREAPGPQEEQPDGSAAADDASGDAGAPDSDAADAEGLPVDTLAAAVLKRSRMMMKERDAIQHRIQTALSKFGVGAPSAAAPQQAKPASSPEEPVVGVEATLLPAVHSSAPGPISAINAGTGTEEEAFNAALTALQRRRQALSSKDGAPPLGLTSAITDSSESSSSSSGQSTTGVHIMLPLRAAGLTSAAAIRAGVNDVGVDDSSAALRARLQAAAPERQAPWRERLRALLAQAGVDPGTSPSTGTAKDSGAAGAGGTAEPAAHGVAASGIMSLQPSPPSQAEIPADPLEAWRRMRERQREVGSVAANPIAPDAAGLGAATRVAAAARGGGTTDGLDLVRRFDGTLGAQPLAGTYARSALADWLGQVSGAAASRAGDGAGGSNSASMPAAAAARSAFTAAGQATGSAAASSGSLASAGGSAAGMDPAGGLEPAVPSVDDLLARLAQRFGLPPGGTSQRVSAAGLAGGSGFGNTAQTAAAGEASMEPTLSGHILEAGHTVTGLSAAAAVPAARPQPSQEPVPPQERAVTQEPQGLLSPELMLPPPPAMHVRAAAVGQGGNTVTELTLHNHQGTAEAPPAAAQAPTAPTWATNRRLHDAFEEAAADPRVSPAELQAASAQQGPGVEGEAPSLSSADCCAPDPSEQAPSAAVAAATDAPSGLRGAANNDGRGEDSERAEGAVASESWEAADPSSSQEWPGWLAALGIPRPVAVTALPAAFRGSSDAGGSSVTSDIQMVDDGDDAGKSDTAQPAVVQQVADARVPNGSRDGAWIPGNVGDSGIPESLPDTVQAPPWPIASLEPILDVSPARRPGHSVRGSSRASLRSSGELASSFASSTGGRFAAILHQTVTAALFADSPGSSVDWGCGAPAPGGTAGSAARSSGGRSPATSPSSPSPLRYHPGGLTGHGGVSPLHMQATAAASGDRRSSASSFGDSVNAGPLRAASISGVLQRSSTSPERLSPLGRASISPRVDGPGAGARHSGVAVLTALGVPPHAPAQHAPEAGAYGGAEDGRNRTQGLPSNRSDAVDDSSGDSKRGEGEELEGEEGGGGGSGGASTSSASTVVSEVYEEDFDEPSPSSSSGSAASAAGPPALPPSTSAAPQANEMQTQHAHAVLGDAASGRVTQQQHHRAQPDWLAGPGTEDAALPSITHARMVPGPLRAPRYAATVAFTTADLSGDVLLGASGMSGDGRVESGSGNLSFDSLDGVDLGLEPEPAAQPRMLHSIMHDPSMSAQTVAAGAPDAGFQARATSGNEGQEPVVPAGGHRPMSATKESESASPPSEDSLPPAGAPLHASLPFSLDLEEFLLRASQQVASGEGFGAEAARSSGAAAAAMAAAAIAAGMVFAGDPAVASFPGTGGGGAASAAADGDGLVFIVEDPLEALLFASGSGGLPFGRRTPPVTIRELSSSDEEGQQEGQHGFRRENEEAQGAEPANAVGAQGAGEASASASGSVEEALAGRAPSDSWRVPSLRDLVSPRGNGARAFMSGPEELHTQRLGNLDVDDAASSSSSSSSDDGVAPGGLRRADGTSTSSAKLQSVRGPQQPDALEAMESEPHLSGSGIAGSAGLSSRGPAPARLDRQASPFGEGRSAANQAAASQPVPSAERSQDPTPPEAAAAVMQQRGSGNSGNDGGGRRAGLQASSRSPRWQEAAPWAAAQPLPDLPGRLEPPAVTGGTHGMTHGSAIGGAGQANAVGGGDVGFPWAMPTGGAAGEALGHSGLRGRLPPISPLADRRSTTLTLHPAPAGNAAQGTREAAAESQAHQSPRSAPSASAPAVASAAYSASTSAAPPDSVNGGSSGNAALTHPPPHQQPQLQSQEVDPAQLHYPGQSSAARAPIRRSLFAMESSGPAAPVEHAGSAPSDGHALPEQLQGEATTHGGVTPAYTQPTRSPPLSVVGDVDAGGIGAELGRASAAASRGALVGAALSHVAALPAASAAASAAQPVPEPVAAWHAAAALTVPHASPVAVSTATDVARVTSAVHAQGKMATTITAALPHHSAFSDILTGNSYDAFASQTVAQALAPPQQHGSQSSSDAPNGAPWAGHLGVAPTAPASVVSAAPAAQYPAAAGAEAPSHAGAWAHAAPQLSGRQGAIDLRAASILGSSATFSGSVGLPSYSAGAFVIGGSAGATVPVASSSLAQTQQMQRPAATQFMVQGPPGAQLLPPQWAQPPSAPQPPRPVSASAGGPAAAMPVAAGEEEDVIVAMLKRKMDACMDKLRSLERNLWSPPSAL